jgi:hypothetical protein
MDREHCLEEIRRLQGSSIDSSTSTTADLISAMRRIREQQRAECAEHDEGKVVLTAVALFATLCDALATNGAPRLKVVQTTVDTFANNGHVDRALREVRAGRPRATALAVASTQRHAQNE